MRSSRAFFLAVLLTFTASAASAATYYVDDSGSNSNPGTLASPFRTITYGLTFLTNPGDTLWVRGGTYNERAVIWNKHGNSTSPIYVGGYNGELPVIDGTGIGNHSTVSINTSSYVTFDGFKVQNAPQTAILMWNAHNITVKYCTVENAMKAGIHAGGDTVNAAHDIVIRNNTVTNTVRENVPGSNLTSGWSQAVSCIKATNVIIRDNWVRRNYGEGIDCILSDYCTIEKNTVYDNKGSNIYLDNAQHSIVDRNYIYNTGNSEYFRDGMPSPGITVANETYSIQNPSTNLTITNNIVHRTGVGFVYYNSQYGGGMHYTLIANNTFYKTVNTATGMIYIEDGSTTNVHDTTTIENNIFYQSTGVRYARAPTVGITWRTNNWYNGTSNTHVAGTGDVMADPLLVAAGGWSATDYKLSSTSTLKTAGTTNAATTDHWGTARTASYSIGAHEYD
ncbi:MAG TPA: right-handed parallel beta-helix repeat-containing protein [Thermoanaerobaculia bacterium]|jgi:parallel beta-helix repeat protein